MLTTYELGCSQSSTSFSDIIINQCEAIADGLVSGFGQFVHDPKFLNQTVELFNQQKIPSRFADAVVLRRIETQKLDDIWDFPLNMTCETTTPLPWTICEATRRGNGQGDHSYEYNIMRIIDFIGRNYVRLVLPEVDTSTIRDSAVTTDPSLYLTDKRHMYLGSWHRDLIPRIIKRVSFYPRQNAHKLFEYSGYDIYIYNILFGNAAKRMNDLMAGEDMFEICYDPYRTHGSALGQATYRGIDNVDQYRTTQLSEGIINISADDDSTLGVDGFTDAWIHDTYMTGAQFKDIYRKNVWYESPVAKNYHVRHSIHSRRFIHSSKIIVFPLDILPFGYSIASSLPTAALAGDCGYISIDIYDNWFDRSFYLTKLSDIPVLFPIVNHQHYVPGDVCYTTTSRNVIDSFSTTTNNSQLTKPLRITASYSKNGIASDHKNFLQTASQTATVDTSNQEITGAILTVSENTPETDITRLMLGWVNPNSIGKYGRLDYWQYLSGRNPKRWQIVQSSAGSTNQTQETIDADLLGARQALNNSHVMPPGALINGPDPSLLEGVIPAAVRPNPSAPNGVYNTRMWTETNASSGNVTFASTIGTPGSAVMRGGINYQSLPTQEGNTSVTLSAFSKDSVADILSTDMTMIYTPQAISSIWYSLYAQGLLVKLLQVGYQSLPSIRQFLSKLPNIYVTTEWSSEQQISMGNASSTTFNINNDLYIQSILFWFIPVDTNGVENLRLYPHNLINHEMPVIPGLRITNEQSQGATVYDWNLLNEITPHLLGLYNPLLENMGLISFTPKLAANKLPLAYYDTNISGYLTINILPDDSQQTQTISPYNLRSGYLKVVSIGTNGVASVNLNLYRLIF